MNGFRRPVVPRWGSLIVALLLSVCCLAVSAVPAFGEGSVDVNTGPETTTRQALKGFATTLYVYAQVGEKVQLGSSAMGIGSGDARLYAPGTGTTTPIFDCVKDAPGTGQIANLEPGREQELAGPLPNPGGYTPCEFTVPATGIYTLLMPGTAAGGSTTTAGTVKRPAQNSSSPVVAIWDVTVRNSGGVIQPGRLFSYNYNFSTLATNVSGVEVYPYTKSGYEYKVNLADQGGVQWNLWADDIGVINATTGERLFASFACGNGVSPNECSHFEAKVEPGGPHSFPTFVNRVDPIVISGRGGLAETSGYATEPITPSSNPLRNAVFTGSAGQGGATNDGSGGTFTFTSPTQMEGLGYKLQIDTDRDGTFGDGSDFIDEGNNLSTTGSNSLSWNGLDGAGAVPACGEYQYQISSTLAQVHFPMNDVENSGGTTIERLTLPSDPELGDPFTASYNDIDPFTGVPVTNTNPSAVTNGNSSVPGFHAWSGETGNTDFIDTWSILPEVRTTGTLRLLCPDVSIEKSSPGPVVPGENATYELKVTNHGPGAAPNVVVSDPLPSGETFVSADPGCAESGGTVTCTIASLDEGTSQTFKVVVKVDSSAKCEGLENTATVTDGVTDPNPGNNSSSVRDCGPKSDLGIEKTASSADVTSGGQVMYTLVVTNHGPGDNTNVTVSDPLAPGLALESAKPSQGECSTAGGKVSCNLGELVAGGSAQVLVTAKVGSPAAAGSGCGNGGTQIANSAEVIGDGFDPSQANNRDEAPVCVLSNPPPNVPPRANPPANPPTNPPSPSQFDLVVKKTANHRQIVGDGKVTYKIAVTNNGPDTAQGVKVKDTFNHQGKVESVKTTAGSCTKTMPISCSLGSLASGAKATITVVLLPLEAACKQTNAAAVEGEGTDTDPASNLSKVQVCVVPKLGIVKKVDHKSVQAGGIVHFTIRVTDLAKKIAATNVHTCDRMPAGLAYVASGPKAKITKGMPCWTKALLKGGKSVVYHVTARALNGVAGVRRNVATAKAGNAHGVKGAAARDGASVVVHPKPPKPTPVTG